jgi:hypothetical protein
MMTKQPLFPLADTPDVDLEQAVGTTVAVGETFATAERIQLDSTSRAAITSAVDIVTSGRSNSRPACATCSDIYLSILFHANMAGMRRTRSSIV